MCAGNSWSSRAKRDAELHSQYGSGQETDEQRNICMPVIAFKRRA